MEQYGKLSRGVPAFRVSAGASAVLLMCWWILSWVLGSFIIMFMGAGSCALARWAVVVQNAVMFILPAVMTALLITSRPWDMLHVDSLPPVRSSVLTICGVIASVPFLNKIVAINESVKLPDGLSGLESMLREFEALAEQMIANIMGEPTVASLLLCVLIIGVLTGVAEELFFRGAMQPIMLSLFRRRHLAVWITAFIFSAMHFEFFGFVPRLLLGAFLGYLTLWSGSVWLSVMAHALNNSLVVVCMWSERIAGEPFAASRLGEGSGFYDWIAVMASALLVVFIISGIYRTSQTHAIKKN